MNLQLTIFHVPKLLTFMVVIIRVSLQTLHRILLQHERVSTSVHGVGYFNFSFYIVRVDSLNFYL